MCNVYKKYGLKGLVIGLMLIFSNQVIAAQQQQNNLIGGVENFTGYKGNVSPDGTMIALLNLGYLIIKNIKSKKSVCSFDNVAFCVWGLDSQCIVLWFCTGSPKMWNVNDNKLISELSISSGYCKNEHCLSWSPDGNWIVMGTKENIRLLDVAGTERFRFFCGNCDEIAYVTWSADSKKIAAIFCENDLYYWGQFLHNRGKVRNIKIWNLMETFPEIVSISQSRSLRHTVLDMQSNIYACVDLDYKGIKIYDIVDIWSVRTYKKSISCKFDIAELVVSPDGSKMAVSFVNNSFSIFDLLTSSEYKFKISNNGLQTIDWPVDDKIVMAYYDGKEDILQVWDLPSVLPELFSKSITQPQVLQSASLRPEQLLSEQDVSRGQAEEHCRNISKNDDSHLLKAALEDENTIENYVNTIERNAKDLEVLLQGRQKISNLDGIEQKIKNSCQHLMTVLKIVQSMNPSFLMAYDLHNPDQVFTSKESDSSKSIIPSCALGIASKSYPDVENADSRDQSFLLQYPHADKGDQIVVLKKQSDDGDDSGGVLDENTWV